MIISVYFVILKIGLAFCKTIHKFLEIFMNLLALLFNPKNWSILFKLVVTFFKTLPTIFKIMWINYRLKSMIRKISEQQKPKKVVVKSETSALEYFQAILQMISFCICTLFLMFSFEFSKIMVPVVGEYFFMLSLFCALIGAVFNGYLLDVFFYPRKPKPTHSFSVSQLS